MILVDDGFFSLYKPSSFISYNKNWRISYFHKYFYANVVLPQWAKLCAYMHNDMALEQTVYIQ